MIFSDNEIEILKERVKSRLSQKRFKHTLGVLASAERLAGYCCPDMISELRAAALLHDITKELSFEEQTKLLASDKTTFKENGLSNPQIIHSFTAPIMVKRDFSEYATEEVLSAVGNHTLGAPDMTVADEIIFLADFIEDGRIYGASVEVREFVYSNMTEGDIGKNINVLHAGCIKEIDFTLKHLLSEGKRINSKNILTRRALVDKILEEDLKITGLQTDEAIAALETEILKMENKLNLSDSAELARFVAAVLIEKKAVDVRIYNVSEDSSVTDYYVNATGRSSTQVNSLADEVVYKAELEGRNALRVEGRSGNAWLLVDYGDVIVNVFDKPSREFYNFDRLLPADGQLDISDIIKAVDEKLKVNNTEEN